MVTVYALAGAVAVAMPLAVRGQLGPGHTLPLPPPAGYHAYVVTVYALAGVVAVGMGLAVWLALTMRRSGRAKSGWAGRCARGGDVGSGGRDLGPLCIARWRLTRRSQGWAF